MKCVDCGAIDKFIKKGTAPNGKKRRRCKECGSQKYPIFDSVEKMTDGIVYVVAKNTCSEFTDTKYDFSISRNADSIFTNVNYKTMKLDEQIKEDNNNMEIGFTPLYDNVLIEKIEEEQITPGGIILTTDVRSTKNHNEGVVIKAGIGYRTTDGKILALSVKEGDNIVYRIGTEVMVKLAGKEYFVISENNIIGVK